MIGCIKSLWPWGFIRTDQAETERNTRVSYQWRQKNPQAVAALTLKFLCELQVCGFCNSGGVIGTSCYPFRCTRLPGFDCSRHQCCCPTAGDRLCGLADLIKHTRDSLHNFSSRPEKDRCMPAAQGLDTVYEDDGKEKGNYYLHSRLGLYRDIAKENGNYYRFQPVAGWQCSFRNVIASHQGPR